MIPFSNPYQSFWHDAVQYVAHDSVCLTHQLVYIAVVSLFKDRMRKLLDKGLSAIDFLGISTVHILFRGCGVALNRVADMVSYLFQ
jgi:hypothetical protein